MEKNQNEATLIPALNIVTAVVVRIKALVEGFQARTLTKKKKKYSKIVILIKHKHHNYIGNKLNDGLFN